MASGGNKEKKNEKQEKEDQRHHASGGMEIWLQLKEELRSELPEQEWNFWVRPIYLLKELSSSHLLLAAPPSSRIVEAYRKREPWLRDKLALRGFSCSLTYYPDAYQLELAALRNPEWAEAAARINRKKASAKITA